MPERVGEHFGDYRLMHRLGGGTFGDVYLGEHISNKTPAAVKVLQARLINPEDLKDYINEIRSLFRLQHPNIVPLLDFGIERDTPFLIMAYAPNGTLRQPKGMRLPLDTVVTYIRQIAEALQHAHDLKLIHRDVKPGNILSGPNGQIWLSDFGIVSIAHSSRSLNTQEGAGTIPYMAPEQILGKPRIASDKYALGIITYEWICGSRPFNGTAIEIAMQHAQAQPPSLCGYVPTLAPTIEQVVLRALAKDPKDRFASVREFAETLAMVVEQSKPWSGTQKTKEQWADEAIAFKKARRYKEALEAFDCAIRIDAKYAYAYIERGGIYYDMKDYARAIENWSRAIALNPRDAFSHSNRGLAHHCLRDYARAIEDFNRAIELDPKLDYAYGGRGLTYYYLNDYRHAVQDFDYALQLDPSITWFKSQREDAYRKLGKRL